jgi:hypothetical protein
MIVHDEPSLFVALVDMVLNTSSKSGRFYHANQQAIWAIVLFIAIFVFLWTLLHPKKGGTPPDSVS